MLILLALVAGFFAMTLQTLPAFAASCTPNATTGCIQGIIKTSAGEPAAGVELALTGPGGEQTVSTDETGRWEFAVDTEGEYTVAVTEATLPEGQFLKSASSRTIEAELFQASSALFPLTDDESAVQQPESDKADPTAKASPDPSETPATKTGAEPTKASGDFSWPRFWQQAASGIRIGLLLALGAVGLSLVFGTTGLANFAHAEMLSMGGILAYLFMGLTGNIWLSGAVAFVLMGLFGWAHDRILWKPLRKRRLSLMQMMIVSIGLSIVLQNIFQFFFGASILRIDPSTPRTVTLLGVTLTVQSYVAMGIALVMIIAVAYAMKYTRFGRATRAVADNRALAEASGIDVERVISVVWTAGTALAVSQACSLVSCSMASPGTPDGTTCSSSSRRSFSAESERRWAQSWGR